MQTFVKLLRDLLTSSENGISERDADKMISGNPEIVRTGIMLGNSSLRAIVFALKMAGKQEGGITEETICECGHTIKPISVLYGTSAFVKCPNCYRFVDVEFQKAGDE